jgi:hypothetical protein
MQWWYFTFGCGQPHEGHFVKIFGTFDEARAEMISRYGLAWAFQYSEKQWHEWENKCRTEGMLWMLETELK